MMEDQYHIGLLEMDGVDGYLSIPGEPRTLIPFGEGPEAYQIACEWILSIRLFTLQPEILEAYLPIVIKETEIG